MASKNQKADIFVFSLAIIGAIITVYINQPFGFFVLIAALFFGMFKRALLLRWI